MMLEQVDIHRERKRKRKEREKERKKERKKEIDSGKKVKDRLQINICKPRI
jgi:hypothetical protein